MFRHVPKCSMFRVLSTACMFVQLKTEIIKQEYQDLSFLVVRDMSLNILL